MKNQEVRKRERPEVRQKETTNNSMVSGPKQYGFKSIIRINVCIYIEEWMALQIVIMEVNI